MPTETVSVQLAADADRSYEIVISPNAITELPETLQLRFPTRHVVIITDEVVAKLYLNRLLDSLHQVVQRVDSIVLPAGEECKSIASCETIWNRLLELGADRKSTILALGGGVIGDLAGFIAATFARGLSLIQVPTTLLAQVDSSVGGKVGINLPRAKNIVGAFWQPQRVLIDPNLLASLDERNFRSGLAEVVKYGVSLDRTLFEFLENERKAIKQRDPDILTQIIAWSCRTKANIVQQDERELTGTRAILNYGHTLGHAIEAVLGFGRYLHGEAVSMGMHFAARLACELGMMKTEDWLRQASLLQDWDLPIQLPATRHAELLECMQRDKKVAAGTLNLVLPQTIGRAVLTPAPSEALMLAIMQELSNR